MSSEKQEWKQEIGQNDLAYQIAGKYFGAKSNGEAWKIWTDLTKNHKQWLAQMAGVSVYDKTIGKQNETIAKRLKNNDVLPFYDYTANAAKIKDFDKVKEIYQTQNLSDQKTFDFYISNLDDAQIDVLNGFSVEQKALFIAEECTKVDKTQEYINSKVESQGNKENKNLAVMKELVDIGQKMSDFIQRHSEKNSELVRFVRVKSDDGNNEGFVDKTTEEQFQSFFEQQKQTDECKKFIEEYGEERAQETYRMLFISKNIDINLLSEDAKREFADIIVIIYEKVKDFGIDLIKMGFDVMYTEAMKIYQSTNMYTQLSSKVMSDKDFDNYFKEPGNKVEQLVPQQEKTLSYHKQLLKLYPKMDSKMVDGTKLSDNFGYFNEDMSVKDSAPESFKKDFSENKAILEKAEQEYGNRLLNHTNAIIQQSAIQQCLTALQKTMDIDISEKENLLEKMELDEDIDPDNTITKKGEQLLLNVKGKVNGKQISLSYDLASGEVYYQKYMQKAGYKDTDSIVIGNTESKKTDLIPLFTLPTLGNVIKRGKELSQNGGYKALMDRSEDLPAYDENCEAELQKSYLVSGSIDHEIGKDIIKKNILEDMIVQKMMSIGERKIPAGQEISSTQFSTTYNFYSYLYRSFQYYAMKPMVQLENMNKNIDDMLAVKEQSNTQSPEEILSQEKKGKNKEWFALHAIVNQKIMGLDNAQMKNQTVESNLLEFFQCFEKKVGGMNILDVDMMSDYFRTSKKNSQEGQVGRWRGNEKFDNLYRNLTSNLTSEMADNILDEQLKSPEYDGKVESSKDLG